MRHRDRRPKLRPTVMIAFLRTRAVRFEQHNGVRVAVMPFRHQPDLTIGREQPLPSEKLAELLQRYVICRNGVPNTFRDGGTVFFAIPDSVEGFE